MLIEPDRYVPATSPIVHVRSVIIYYRRHTHRNCVIKLPENYKREQHKHHATPKTKKEIKI